ncbi:MAG TPA: hypothetical protein VNZ03_16600 [Terriglobales bacterium]|nr:hypothetical protein [Terriglobales bacterium]
MKSVFFAAVLIAALIPVAMAQGVKSQPASLGEKIQVRGTSTVMSHDWQPVQVPTIPSYCKPCYFYAGDMDPNNSNNNGLANEEDQLVADSHIYSPFKVKAVGAHVSGLFVNSLDTVGAIDNPTPWSISKGVKVGVAGHVVAHGTATSTDTPTGRSAFGLTEYTHLVKFHAKALKGGTYFENVTPVCLTGSSCGSARYFESDEEDDPAPLNHVGSKNILDDSFWNSTSFGQNYSATWGSSGGCGGIGCDMFSAGVLGKK